jgi:hypothetical protein
MLIIWIRYETVTKSGTYYDTYLFMKEQCREKPTLFFEPIGIPFFFFLFYNIGEPPPSRWGLVRYKNHK